MKAWCSLFMQHRSSSCNSSLQTICHFMNWTQCAACTTEPLHYTGLQQPEGIWPPGREGLTAVVRGCCDSNDARRVGQDIVLSNAVCGIRLDAFTARNAGSGVGGRPPASTVGVAGTLGGVAVQDVVAWRHHCRATAASVAATMSVNVRYTANILSPSTAKHVPALGV